VARRTEQDFHALLRPEDVERVEGWFHGEWTERFAPNFPGPFHSFFLEQGRLPREDEGLPVV
jgi:hypothetical protein